MIGGEVGGEFLVSGRNCLFTKENRDSAIMLFPFFGAAVFAGESVVNANQLTRESHVWRL